MIVTCEQCEAQFRLDDSKVPEGGARVRCSKCKHAFFIEPPGRVDAVAADALARDALAGGSDESESDWQFNDDTPATAEAPGADREAARQAVDGLLGGQPAGSRPPAPAAAVPASAPSGSAPPLEAEAPGLDTGGLDSSPSGLETDDGELGDPESWDLLGDDDADKSSAQIGRVALKPRWKVLEEERSEPERALGERAAAAATSDDARPGRLGRLLQGVMAGIGWAAALGLLAAGVWSGISPVSAADVPESAELSTAGFRATEIEGRWIENAIAGPLFVVSGWLSPADASARGAAGPLAVRLLDARGNALAPSTPVGPPFPADVLRERDPADLVASQQRAAAHFARLNDGERTRFQAVFAGVPPEASRFVLEQARGSSGQAGRRPADTAPAEAPREARGPGQEVDSQSTHAPASRKARGRPASQGRAEGTS
jgi:predicted Zn finger-like uncharacterized protein